MAPHSNTLAWRIPGMVEPGGLPSVGSHRVGHDWSNLAAAAGRQGSPWFYLFGSAYYYFLMSLAEGLSLLFLIPRLKNNFMYLFSAVLALHCCEGFALVVEAGAALQLCAGSQLRWPVLLRSTGSRPCGLSSCGFRSIEHRLNSWGTWSCYSMACGIFLDQGLNLCILHWQVDSLLSHQGSPSFVYLF